MKKIIIIFIIVFTATKAEAQFTERLYFATTVGAGIAISEPAYTPFTWQFLGHYAISKQFLAGIGTGLSFYEGTLIPLFANAQLMISKPQKVIPYLECSIGYSVAISKNTNGGFYLNPSVGMKYAIRRDKKVFIALGYELQKSAQLKKLENSFFLAEFAEQISHNSISIKVGFMF